MHYDPSRGAKIVSELTWSLNLWLSFSTLIIRDFILLSSASAILFWAAYFFRNFVFSTLAFSSSRAKSFCFTEEQISAVQNQDYLMQLWIRWFLSGPVKQITSWCYRLQAYSSQLSWSPDYLLLIPENWATRVNPEYKLFPLFYISSIFSQIFYSYIGEYNSGSHNGHGIYCLDGSLALIFSTKSVRLRS